MSDIRPLFKKNEDNRRNLKNTPEVKMEYFDGYNWYYVATENYVNRLVTEACALATTQNMDGVYTPGSQGVGSTLTISLTNGTITIDGVEVLLTQRVLFKEQTTQLQNGIYVLTNINSGTSLATFTRATDYDSIEKIAPGDIVAVSSGTANAVTLWMQTSPMPSVDINPITFTLLAKAGGSLVVEGTPNEIDVTMSSGVATVAMSANPTIPGQAGMVLPQGDSTLRPPTPSSGTIRFNTNPV